MSSPLHIVLAMVGLVFVLIAVRYIVTDPYTLQSTQNAQTASTIAAASLATNGTNVPSSNFAYSVWFYVNDWNYRYGEPKVIFGRMGSQSSTSTSASSSTTSSTPTATTSVPGVSGIDPCPAVVLGAVENNVSVSLGCYPGADQEPSTPGGTTVIHTCRVANVPIQKWVNLVMSVFNRTMDLYIDGKLVRTCLLPGVACVNSNANIYVTPAGGFSGWTAKLQYFPDSVNPQEAWNLYTRGYSSWLSIFNSYQLQIALVENGTTQSSVTI